MHFDLTALALASVMLIAGVIAVPIGGSMTFVIPTILILGFNARSALFMICIAYYAVTLGSGSYLIRTNTLNWRVVMLLGITGGIGSILAVWFATHISLATLTPIIAWIVVGGGILAAFRIHPREHLFGRYKHIAIGTTNMIVSFYGLLGGSGHNSLMSLLMHSTYNWTLKNGLIHRRVASVFMGWMNIVFFLILGARPTGYEIPLIIGGLLGGYLGGRTLDNFNETWLRWIFLAFASFTAVKVTFF